MPSILDPLCCGFMKIAIYELCMENVINPSDKTWVINVNNKVRKEFDGFVELFSVCKNFDVTFDWYRRNVIRIKECLQKLAKDSTPTRKKLLDCFGKSIWSEISLT